jgi:hypothetical protein
MFRVRFDHPEDPERSWDFSFEQAPPIPAPGDMVNLEGEGPGGRARFRVNGRNYGFDSGEVRVVVGLETLEGWKP